MTDNVEENGPSGAQKMFGDFAPALVDFTDDILFSQVWTRPQLSPKERSLVTVAALTATGSTEQLVFHLGLARENGATEEELIEAITHLGMELEKEAFLDERAGASTEVACAGRRNRFHRAVKWEIARQRAEMDQPGGVTACKHGHAREANFPGLRFA